MALYEVNPREKVSRGQVAPVRVEEYFRMSKTFSGVAGGYTESLAETSGSLPERLVIARVSPRFFSTLGTPPLAGRGFSPEEDLFSGPNAAVISERFWRRRFNASPTAVGTTIRLGGNSYPIVGIVPDSFRYPSSDVDIWTPCGLPPPVATNRQARFYQAVGRVRDGVPLSTAQAELNSVQAQLALQYPKTDANWTVLAEPLKEDTIGGARRSLWILYAAVSVILLIACANVACLLLAQARLRRREIAIRFSIGARRWQVVRELLLESLCLAIPGAACGLALSVVGARLLRQSATSLPRADEIHVDWRIVIFYPFSVPAHHVLIRFVPGPQCHPASRVEGRSSHRRAHSWRFGQRADRSRDCAVGGRRPADPDFVTTRAGASGIPAQQCARIPC